ncbi:MAG: hypothetical protein RIE77_06705 [Phycisphaerales bacterium]|jgi:hypothetical protein
MPTPSGAADSQGRVGGDIGRSTLEAERRFRPGVAGVTQILAQAAPPLRSLPMASYPDAFV